jgi:hypothetical protein
MRDSGEGISDRCDSTGCDTKSTSSSCTGEAIDVNTTLVATLRRLVAVVGTLRTTPGPCNAFLLLPILSLRLQRFFKVLSQALDGPCRDAHELCDFADVERVCRVFDICADPGGVLGRNSLPATILRSQSVYSFDLVFSYIYIDGADGEFPGATGVLPCRRRCSLKLSVPEFLAAHGESVTQGSGCGKQMI